MADPDILSVGGDGKVLIADSAEVLGLRWGDIDYQWGNEQIEVPVTPATKEGLGQQFSAITQDIINISGEDLLVFGIWSQIAQFTEGWFWEILTFVNPVVILQTSEAIHSFPADGDYYFEFSTPWVFPAGTSYRARLFETIPNAGAYPTHMFVWTTFRITMDRIQMEDRQFVNIIHDCRPVTQTREGVNQLSVGEIAEPASPASGHIIYTDQADGKLKSKSSTGVVTELANP